MRHTDRSPTSINSQIKNNMKATDGITTVVDHTHYNLNLKEAAKRLKSKRSTVAVKCPDYSQEYLESIYQEPVVLNWQDYFDQDDVEIIESIRMYEQFGIYE
jgi:hypothetical protein